MPDYRLTPAPALGPGKSGRFEVGGYCIAENTGFAMTSISARTGSQETVMKNLKAALETDLPSAGRFKSNQGRTAFWTGPGQWMMLASNVDHELQAVDLANRLIGDASVTEQNDGWACFDVTGPDLEAVFERLAAMDVRQFTTGMATRTVIEHVACFLLCMETRTHFRTFAGRSYAHSLLHAVKSALESTSALNAIKTI